MVAILILGLALLSGATAFQLKDVQTASNGTSNSTVLQQYPFVVQVDFLNIWGWGGWTQNCGATILTSVHVLSATTCFSGATYPGAYGRRIRAGANYRHSGGMFAYVEREINYQWIITAPLLHDISVIRLASNLLFSGLIRQGAIIAPGIAIPNGVTLRQVGWGPLNGTVPLSSATVLTYTTASNQTTPSNATSWTLRARPSAQARLNSDIGGPWVIDNVTVGIIAGVNRAVNGSWSDSLVAAAVSFYTPWILSVAV